MERCQATSQFTVCQVRGPHRLPVIDWQEEHEHDNRTADHWERVLSLMIHLWSRVCWFYITWMVWVQPLHGEDVVSGLTVGRRAAGGDSVMLSAKKPWLCDFNDSHTTLPSLNYPKIWIQLDVWRGKLGFLSNVLTTVTHSSDLSFPSVWMLVADPQLYDKCTGGSSWWGVFHRKRPITRSHFVTTEKCEVIQIT